VTWQHCPRSYCQRNAVVSAGSRATGEHPGLVAAHHLGHEACDSLPGPGTNKATARSAGCHSVAVPPAILSAMATAGCPSTDGGKAYRLSPWPNNAFSGSTTGQLRRRHLADGFSSRLLHRGARPLWRNSVVRCPAYSGKSYHWSLMQVEYATDLAFRSTATLGPLYEQLVRQRRAEREGGADRHLPWPPDHPTTGAGVGSQFSTRIEGTCVKHRFGKSSIKMYDKAGIVLRIETTANDVSFFKHHRKVETPQRALHPRSRTGQEVDLQPDRTCRDILRGCNHRFSGSSLRIGRLPPLAFVPSTG